MQVLLFPKIIGCKLVAVATMKMAKKPRLALGRNNITT